MFRRSSINQGEWFRHSWRNRLQTSLLLGFLGGYLGLLGWLIWGSAALIWLLAMLGILLLLVPSGSAHLLMKLHGARPLNRAQAPEMYSLVDQLAQRAELEQLPALYYLPMRQPNAMAVGSREGPIIGISEGLLRLLNRRELAGVLAHEISHLRTDDIRVMRLADLASLLTGSLSIFGQILLLLYLPLTLFTDHSVNWLLVLLLIFAPQISTLAQLGLSRVREFNADLGATTLTGDPEGLAFALQKIQRQSGGFFQRMLPGHAVPHWMRTHPPTNERIRRLMEVTETSLDRPATQDHSTYRTQRTPAFTRVIRVRGYRISPEVLNPHYRGRSKDIDRNRPHRRKRGLSPFSTPFSALFELTT